MCLSCSLYSEDLQRGTSAEGTASCEKSHGKLWQRQAGSSTKIQCVRFAHQINKTWDALFWEMRQPSYQGNIKKCAEVSRGAFMMPMPTLLYYFYWQWHWTGSPSWTFAFAKEMSDIKSVHTFYHVQQLVQEKNAILAIHSAAVYACMQYA